MGRPISSRVTLAFLACASAALLSACSGGGGSGGGGGNPLPPVNTSTPAPTYTLSGIVADTGTNGGNGAGIAGATVAFYAQNVALTTPIATATTGPTGAYSITLQNTGSYTAQVTPPTSSAPTGFDYPLFHAKVTVTASVTEPTFKLDRLTADDQAWIVKTNSDRASYGAAALKADETAMQVARAWANQLALTPLVGHGGSGAPQQRYATVGGIGADSENIGLDLSDGPWNGTETAFMAESQNCPQPATFNTCPNPSNGQETGHFLNIVNPAQVWIGVGENLNGVSSPPGSTWSDFDAEYISYP